MVWLLRGVAFSKPQKLWLEDHIYNKFLGVLGLCLGKLSGFRVQTIPTY
jgi:hypothetical protein